MIQQTPRSRRVSRRSPDEIRREILDATEAILLEEGYEGFSIRKLVERCGHTAPQIYQHFGDKNGLIDALLEERFGELVEQLRAVPITPDPTADLIALSLAFVRFAFENPTYYRLMMAIREPGEPLEAGEEARRILERPSQELEAEGRLAMGDAELFRQAAWAQLHGLISLRASRPDIEWRDDLLDCCLEGLTRGWLRDARPGAPADQSDT